MKAILKNYRQSPRKVRVVADTIRGKDVSVAELNLSFLPKRASDPILGLLRSAVANALANNQANPEGLFVKDIRVEKGLVLKRFMPAARGSAHPVKKRASHVIIEL